LCIFQLAAIIGRIGPGDRRRDAAGAGAERLELEHAHGAVPQDRLRVGHDARVVLDRPRTDVEAHHVARDLGGRHRAPLGAQRDLGRRDHVERQFDQHSPFVRSLLRGPHVVEPVAFAEARADLAATGRDQGERHRSADQQGVDPVEQRVDHGELVAHLGPAEDGDVGAGGVVQEPAEHLDLALHQSSGDRRASAREHQGRQGAHAGMRPMGSSEGIVDVGVGELGEASRERPVVGFLTGVEPQVLQQHDRVVGQGLGRRLGQRPHGLADQRGESVGHGCQSQVVVRRSLGTTEVRSQDEPGPALPQRTQGGHGRGDARVVGHRPRLERHIEVGADEHARAGDLAEVVERAQRHVVVPAVTQSDAATREVRSISRFE
jgi:hypothetical protein